MMNDIHLEWSADLVASSTGELALVNASVQTNQRVLRRLLTNPGDYIWNLSYGGGLALYVGSDTNSADIEAAIRTQMALEVAVPVTPAPNVSVRTFDSVGGGILAQITYADPLSSSLVNLTVRTN